MFGVRGVGPQGGAVGEFGDEHNVAGIVDVADIKADFDVSEAIDPAFQALEQGLDLGPRRRALFCGLPRQPPHHDVPDRPRHLLISSPAAFVVCGHFALRKSEIKTKICKSLFRYLQKWTVCCNLRCFPKRPSWAASPRPPRRCGCRMRRRAAPSARWGGGSPGGWCGGTARAAG